MNGYFNVTTSFPYHPKTIKLIRSLGYEGLYSLITLWAFTAENKPDGVLTNMGIEDIETAAYWDNEPKQFVSTLLRLRLLDLEKNSVYKIHNWEKYNGTKGKNNV